MTTTRVGFTSTYLSGEDLPPHIAQIEQLEAHTKTLTDRIDQVLAICDEAIEGKPPYRIISIDGLVDRIRSILDPHRPTHDCDECEGLPACVCPDPDRELLADIPDPL